MAVNEFKTFATGENANVISQAEFDDMAARDVGFETGIARSEQLNKVWRQASVIAHVIGEFIADSNDEDVVDDGDTVSLKKKLKSALLTNAREAIPEASLAISGTTKLSNATDSDSETVAATSKAVKTALTRSLDMIYPVGVVMWFAQNKNPNDLFPGTTWKYVGENRTVRLASATGTDLLTVGGADTVSLTASNIPSHSHSFSAATNSFDYGTKTTSSFDYGTKTSTSFDYGTRTSSSFDYGSKSTSNAGAHTHTYNQPRPNSKPTVYINTQGFHSGETAFTTPSAGAHTHTVSIGAHTHSVALGAHTHAVALGTHNHTVSVGAHTHTVSGTTGAVGSGAAFSVSNSYIKLMAWYRVS